MIKIILIISALMAGLILGPEISENKGYLLISFDSYTTYETTILNAAFSAAAFYFLLLLAEWVIRRLLSMSTLTRGWFGQRKTKSAQKNSLLGMLALLEGRNKQAQKLLAQSAQRSAAPVLTYISAAKAAQLEAQYDKRDDYLQLAVESDRSAQLAVGLVWTELQIEAKQYQNALATLTDLQAKFPKSKQITLLYLSLYPCLEQWQQYIDLLTTQGKNLDTDEQALAALTLNGYQQLFKQLVADSPVTLKLFWDKKAPRWMRKAIDYQEAMLKAYISAKHGKYAQELLIEQLNKHFSLALLGYVNKVAILDHFPLITLLEKQLKKSTDKSLIHYALAQLKLKENNPVDAIKHLEMSVEEEANRENCALLASLLEQYDRQQEANTYYRQGLLLATTPSTDVITV